MELKVTKVDILGFFLLITVIVMEANITFQQHCPSAITSQHGHALVGTEYASLITQDYANCMMHCHDDERCMSVNFHLLTKTCDLNTQTKESRPACFQTRANSIYTTNMAFRAPKIAKSCREIKVSCRSQESGEYWIDPEQRGNPIKVLCDMTTDGGGWTVVKKTVLQGSEVPPNKYYASYKVLTAYNMNEVNIIARSRAMLNIRLVMGFDQIHFYCYKRLVGRVVSIMTKNNTAGQNVVRYFTNDTYAKTTLPDACDSFDRLPQDTSILSRNCKKWGKDFQDNTEANKWGFPSSSPSRMVSNPFMIVTEPRCHYGTFNGNSHDHYKCLCDDSMLTPEKGTVNDTWMIAVR